MQTEHWCILFIAPVYRELKAACKQLLAEAASGKQASTYAFHAKDVHFGPVHSSGGSSTTAGALRRSSTTAVTTTTAASSVLSAFSRVKSLTDRHRHSSSEQLQQQQQQQQQQHYVTAEVGGYTCRKYECAAEVRHYISIYIYSTHQLQCICLYVRNLTYVVCNSLAADNCETCYCYFQVASPPFRQTWRACVQSCKEHGFAVAVCRSTVLIRTAFTLCELFRSQCAEAVQ
jgi:hypothetical protein